MTDGIVVVDKPEGWTSHDVVGRVRRLAGTRRVGHAGTLDPMATGVLVVGIGRATRLLGHLSGHDKEYMATIRLGWGTTTDDAAGGRLPGKAGDRSDGSVTALDPAEIEAAVVRLTGAIEQRPAAVSAIKVDGRRAHARVRAGEVVKLAARPVVIHRFDILGSQPRPELAALDLDIAVAVSSGTYVRALARDLGSDLGVGGHLIALRRTSSGPFRIEEARTLDELAESLVVTGLAEVARSAFPFVVLAAVESAAVRFGQRVVPWRDLVDPASSSQAWALLDEADELLALARPDDDGLWRYLAVLAPPSAGES